MLAEAAVKGLQSTESFNIELRKTKDSKAQTPGGADKFLPYKDLMLLHIKGNFIYLFIYYDTASLKVMLMTKK